MCFISKPCKLYCLLFKSVVFVFKTHLISIFLLFLKLQDYTPNVTWKILSVFVPYFPYSNLLVALDQFKNNFLSPTLSFCFLYCHKVYRNNTNAFRKFFLLRFQLAQSIWKSTERPKTVKKSSSEYGHVGTLSRRAEKPDSMQKELVHFDVLELRKRPKTVKKGNFQNLPILYSFWTFSQLQGIEIH